MAEIDSIGKPQKIVLTSERWLCAKGHKHTSEARALKCNQAKKIKPLTRNNPPPGYVSCQQARDIFKEAGMVCSSDWVSRLASGSYLQGMRLGPKKPWLILQSSVLNAIGEGKTPIGMLGLKTHVRCPVCHRPISVTTKEAIYRHGLYGGQELCPGSGQRANLADAVS